MSQMFVGGNQMVVMPELALTTPTVWSRAITLAREAQGLIQANGILWERPVTGMDRQPLLARYPWGLYGFRGLELPGRIDDADVRHAVPHSYQLIGLEPLTASSADRAQADVELFHAQLCALATILVEQTVSAAKRRDVLTKALQNMTERRLNVGDDTQRQVVAHSGSITIGWAVDLSWLDAHPELRRPPVQLV